jgi:anti-sigma B factor antagonist
LSLGKEQHGSIWVLTPHKDLMGGQETKELEEAVRDIGASGPPQVIVDVSKISYMNSTGLGSLVSLHMACQNRQGFLRLAGISKRIKNLFLVTKLAFVFETFDGVADALANKDSGLSENQGN